MDENTDNYQNINVNQFRDMNNSDNYVDYIERLLENIDLEQNE